MKRLVIAGIRFYWLVVPKRFRRRCVYQESCSHYVARTTREFGFLEGLRALLLRYRNCRGDYRSVFVPSENKWTLHLVGGDILEISEISPQLRKELRI